MPTTPTSLVNRLMGAEAFTDGLKATSVSIGAGGSEVALAATPAEINRTCQNSSRIVTAITTLPVTVASHEGRTILLSLVGGFTSTLPAATGSGGIYRFTVGIVTTGGNSYVIHTAGSDVFNGSIYMGVSTAATGKIWVSTTGVAITLNATTTGGGAIGDTIIVQDIAAAVWSVTGITIGSSTLATPFS